MTPRKLLGLIILLAAVALSACGGGDDNGGTPQPAQPTQADVFIAFDQPVTNLAGLDFRLNNAAGATFDDGAGTPLITAINAAQGSLVVANFDAATNSNQILLVNGGAAGFNTGTAPIIKVTYAIAAGSGSPTFSIASQATFSAIAFDNGPTTPPVTPANLVVTVTYQ
jgi:hypothetical protein